MATRKVEEHMDDRLKSILCAIVENYIETLEPVGSRTLSKGLSLNLSPATIRNSMADLTELEYLEQPHTSAGRVPTNRAYRYYVEHCINSLEENALSEEMQTVILPRSGMITDSILELSSQRRTSLTVPSLEASLCSSSSE